MRIYLIFMMLVGIFMAMTIVGVMVWHMMLHPISVVDLGSMAE